MDDKTSKTAKLGFDGPSPPSVGSNIAAPGTKNRGAPPHSNVNSSEGSIQSPSGFEIVIDSKQLPEAVSAMTQALISYNDPPTLFDRDGQLVKLILGTGYFPELKILSISEFRCELAYAARWFEKSGSAVRAVYPPALVAHCLLSRREQWAPPLRAVVNLPVFGDGWKLLLEPGYHSRDQLYYQPNHS